MHIGKNKNINMYELKSIVTFGCQALYVGLAAFLSQTIFYYTKYGL